MKEIELNMMPSHLLHQKISERNRGRKTSRQIIMKNLGLCPLVEQRNEQGLAAIHLAAAAGNM